MKFIKQTIIALMGFVACAVAQTVTVDPVFTSNMVLQREAPIRIWGTGNTSGNVLVTFGSQSVSAPIVNGKWKVSLNALPAGGPYTLQVQGQNLVNLIQYANVMVGDVWLCSGQSNMSWNMFTIDNKDEYVAAANFPKIRLLNMPHPNKPYTPEWKVCTPKTALGMSAVGYFFGKAIHTSENIPIGLINASVGGSTAKTWTSTSSMNSNPTLAHLVTDWDPNAKFASVTKPSVNYNAMILPLMPMSIKGVIWWQGEADSSEAKTYRTLLPTLISDWRNGFQNSNFPFLIMQLATVKETIYPTTPPAESAWAELREAQDYISATDISSGMAVIYDLTPLGSLHPKNKDVLAERLVNVAKAKVYGKSVPYLYPSYNAYFIEGNAIRINFDSPKGLRVRGSGALKHFEICGPDKKFVWANAVIQNNSVVVSSPNVISPQAVRYAWAQNPSPANLESTEGLPAIPFRTDEP